MSEITLIELNPNTIDEIYKNSVSQYSMEQLKKMMKDAMARNEFFIIRCWTL